MTGLVAALGAALAIALLVPPRHRIPSTDSGPLVDTPSDAGWLIRHRLLWSVLAGAGASTFIGGRVGLVGALVVAVVAWTFIGRAEPADVRRRREQVRHDLPAVVTLVAAALRSGAAPGDAVTLVARALPGHAADRLATVSSRLRLGADPAMVWSDLAADAELAPLGRTMARAHATGAPVVVAIERLAEDLARSARGAVEDRARAVGVKAAVPLGLCLLPAFVLIGIVPLVAGLMTTLAW